MNGHEQPRLYLGYRHGFVGNPKGFRRDEAVTYIDQGGVKDLHVPYLHGVWIVRPDEIEYAGEPERGAITVLMQEHTLRLIGDAFKFKVRTKEHEDVKGTRHNIVECIPLERGARLRELVFRDARS